MERNLLVAVLLCACSVLAGCAVPPRAATPTPPTSGLGATRAVPPTYEIYEVQKGDTLFRVGQRFGVSWQQIAGANEISAPYRLKVGMPLLIPRGGAAARPQTSAALPVRRGPPPPLPVSESDLHRGKPSSRFWWPTRGRLVQCYGDTVRGLPEPGIAMAASRGTEVRAAAAGTVITAIDADPASGAAWGNVLAVSHPGGMVSWYAHLDRILVEKGTRVDKGELIGTVGSSGAAPGAQLAFRLFRNQRPIDPEDHLP
ncbi:MAG: peptidoglycan DD-metalloendopeptidase family protein [Planctomycetota bacterium]